MKVVAFNGSPRKEGNTYHALKLVTDELEKSGIDTEIIHVGNKTIRGCIACNQCIKNRDERCAIANDEVNEWVQVMKESDGIILGSPVHFAAIGGTMKSFLDRAFYVSSMNGNLLRHKVGASVVAVRRSGGLPTFNQLNNYLNYSEITMPNSNYWNVIHGARPGEVLQDEEGVQIMRILGKNLAWSLQKNTDNQQEVTEPEMERKIYTNFIR